MKNPNQECLNRRMRQYHRHHQWRLESSGLFIPHAYPDLHALSWGDDVGFILNGRRVMVCWTHPRKKYADAIQEAAWSEAGEPPPSSNDIFDETLCTKRYQRLGRSRKKVVSYQSPPRTADTTAYYANYREIQERISTEGIDLIVRPSLNISALRWCTFVDLCYPVEVRSEEDVVTLASLVRIILTGGREIIGPCNAQYQYGRKEWLGEASDREKDRDARQKENKAKIPL